MTAPCDTLSISGLPAGSDEASLKGIFGAYGDITSVRILPPQAGKHVAIMKFATVDEATWIQENLNGNMPEGLTEPIEVKFSADKGKGKDFGKGSKGGWSKGYDNGGKGDWSNGYDKGGDKGGKDGYSKGGKGDKGDSWGPYAKGGKDFGGKDFGGKGKDGKGKGKGKISIRTLFEGLCSAGALPGGSKYENDENTCFVGGLPQDTTDLDLYKIFSPFGAIAPKGIKAMIHVPSGNCKGYGFVNFMDQSATQAAMAALHGTTMGEEGATLEVLSKRLDGGKGDGKGDGKGKWS